ncbi:hypothetical protein AGMMS50267_16400 [Spirochaetia bacterium]|nr:hypothetical protein AGMMS50267_16400 [Spirochaetia bacterium]
MEQIKPLVLSLLFMGLTINTFADTAFTEPYNGYVYFSKEYDATGSTADIYDYFGLHTLRIENDYFIYSVPVDKSKKLVRGRGFSYNDAYFMTTNQFHYQTDNRGFPIGRFTPGRGWQAVLVGRGNESYHEAIGTVKDVEIIRYEWGYEIKWPFNEKPMEYWFQEVVREKDLWQGAGSAFTIIIGSRKIAY